MVADFPHKRARVQLGISSTETRHDDETSPPVEAKSATQPDTASANSQMETEEFTQRDRAPKRPPSSPHKQDQQHQKTMKIDNFEHFLRDIREPQDMQQLLLVAKDKVTKA